MHRVSQLYSFFFFSLNEVLFIFKMFIEVELLSSTVYSEVTAPLFMGEFNS